MDEIKVKLLEMQNAILTDLEAEHNLSVTSVTNEIGDSIDHASEERERELHQLMCDRDRIKLNSIKHALERIDDSSYGLCEVCETKIGKKRLMALPFAKMCVDCQAEDEKARGKGVYYGIDAGYGNMDTEADR